jgi:diaminopimelate epimerase
MGTPTLKCTEIPVTFPQDEMINQPMEVDGKIYPVTCVSMGNPHCVTFMEEDVRKLDLEKIGPSFENHETFPKRVTTELANILDRKHIRMRVWERGSGETLACGTGACASAVATIFHDLTERNVTVHLPGGDLIIQWKGNTSPVFMTGPATEVFRGEWGLKESTKDEVQCTKEFKNE